MADAASAIRLLRRLKPFVGWAKIGMELFYSGGPAAYEAVAREGVPIFLDLKLHDIPNTVARSLGALMRLTPSPAMVNVHASGGFDMMRAAVEIVDGGAQLVAAAILPSLLGNHPETGGFDPRQNPPGPGASPSGRAG